MKTVNLRAPDPETRARSGELWLFQRLFDLSFRDLHCRRFPESPARNYFSRIEMRDPGAAAKRPRAVEYFVLLAFIPRPVHVLGRQHG